MSMCVKYNIGRGIVFNVFIAFYYIWCILCCILSFSTYYITPNHDLIVGEGSCTNGCANLSLVPQSLVLDGFMEIVCEHLNQPILGFFGAKGLRPRHCPLILKCQNVQVVPTVIYMYNDIFDHDKVQILKWHPNVRC